MKEMILFFPRKVEFSKNYRKSDAKARSPGTSQRAIAVSIFALISPDADGLRPIACIAPIPIRPIPSPEPITPSRAIPFI
jgi:hypothetical protein